MERTTGKLTRQHQSGSICGRVQAATQDLLVSNIVSCLTIMTLVLVIILSFYTFPYYTYVCQEPLFLS